MRKKEEYPEQYDEYDRPEWQYENSVQEWNDFIDLDDGNYVDDEKYSAYDGNNAYDDEDYTYKGKIWASASYEKDHVRRGRAWRGAILWGIPALALTVFLGCAVYLLPKYLEYRRAAAGYASLQESTIRLWEKAVYVQAEGDDAEEGKPEEPMTEFPVLEIDFDKLVNVNEDFVGVLYIPVLDVLYPVTHSKDNREYERITYDGQRNSSGAIFLDAFNSRDLSDRNSFIYGHNMKDLTMFGKLKYFMQYPNLCNTNPYFYIYRSDRIFKYRIFAYYAVNARDFVYSSDSYNWSDAEYDEFVRRYSYRTLYLPDDSEIDFSLRPRLMNLSTCFGDDHVTNFIVHGALVATGSYEDILRQVREDAVEQAR